MKQDFFSGFCRLRMSGSLNENTNDDNRKRASQMTRDRKRTIVRYTINEFQFTA